MRRDSGGWGVRRGLSLPAVSSGPASLAWTLGPSTATKLSPPRASQRTLKETVLYGHTTLNMPSLI